MKSPYDEVVSIFRENLNDAVENDKSAQSFLDSFTTWLLGLSVGSIALLIGNIEAISKYYSICTIKGIVILLPISIIFGILHRLLLFYLTVKYNHALFYVKGALSEKEVMTTEIVDLSTISSIDELVMVGKLDFDIDFSKERLVYNDLDDTNKKLLFDDMLRYYHETNLRAKKSFEDGMEYVTKIMKDVYLYQGKSYKISLEAKNPNLQKLNILQIYCLYLSCLTFIIALIMVMVGFEI